MIRSASSWLRVVISFTPQMACVAIVLFSSSGLFASCRRFWAKGRLDISLL